MNDDQIVLVIDQNDELISRLKGYAFVVYISDLKDVMKVRCNVQQPSKIHCIVFDDPYSSLSSLELDSEWKGISLQIYISGIGDFCKVAQIIPLLRELDIRIFFHANSRQAIIDAQILSSLRINSGVVLSHKHNDWDELNDLIHYSIYSRMLHAPIEPFSYLCNNYNQNDSIDIKGAYFNSPDRYIHINYNEEISLYREDLLSGKYIAKGIDQLKNIHQNPLYIEDAIAWQNQFLKEDGCAYCPAWRICKGYFEQCDDKGKCREVFSELLEAVEFYQNSNKSEKISNLCQL